jgi:hypothetical protein
MEAQGFFDKQADKSPNATEYLLKSDQEKWFEIYLIV